MKSTVSIETNQFDVHTAPAPLTAGHQPQAAEVLSKCLQLQVEFAGEGRGILSIQPQPSHPKCYSLQFISAVRELIRNILPLLHFEGWVICQLPPCYLPADGLVQNTWGRRTQMGNQNRTLQHFTCTCAPIYSVFLQVKKRKGIFLFAVLHFTVENYLESGTAYSALPDLKKSLPVIANAALTPGCRAGEAEAGESGKLQHCCCAASSRIFWVIENEVLDFVCCLGIFTVKHNTALILHNGIRNWRE